MLWWLSRAVRKGQQPPWVVPDELWERIEPLLPQVARRYRHPGRKRLDDRKVLSGILFVLYTGIPWEFLPQELGFGSGMTAWRRLRDCPEAGVWQRLHEALLAELNAAGACPRAPPQPGGDAAADPGHRRHHEPVQRVVSGTPSACGVGRRRHRPSRASAGTRVGCPGLQKRCSPHRDRLPARQRGTGKVPAREPLRPLTWWVADRSC